MTRFQSKIHRICTRTWHQRMTAWRQSTPASDLWTVVLSSQTQLYPAPLSTHVWTPRLHTQTASTVAIGPPFRPTSLHSSGPVCLLETDLETGPWRSWKWAQGHLGREFQGHGYQRHDLEGVVHVLCGHMGKTCLDKGQRGSKVWGPSVWEMQKWLPRKLSHVS